MSRSRRRSGRRGLALVFTLCLLFVAVGGYGTGAYTTSHIDRTGSVSIVTDTSGVYGIDTATAVHTNETERLVTLTNNFDRDVSVTVSLRSSSTDAGDLVVGGTNEGDEVVLSLPAGDVQRIDIAVVDESSLVGQTVDFDAQASATGLHVTAPNRSVPVES